MKTFKDTPEKLNYVLACIIQSLIGSLTENIQRVSYSIDGSIVNILFNLGEHDAEDEEEIDDAIFELEAIFGGEFQVNAKVHIGEIYDIDEQSLIVFRMRHSIIK